jgi:hypothetical protein
VDWSGGKPKIGIHANAEGALGVLPLYAILPAPLTVNSTIGLLGDTHYQTGLRGITEIRLALSRPGLQGSYGRVCPGSPLHAVHPRSSKMFPQVGFEGTFVVL